MLSLQFEGLAGGVSPQCGPKGPGDFCVVAGGLGGRLGVLVLLGVGVDEGLQLVIKNAKAIKPGATIRRVRFMARAPFG